MLVVLFDKTGGAAKIHTQECRMCHIGHEPGRRGRFVKIEASPDVLQDLAERGYNPTYCKCTEGYKKR